MTLVWIAFGVTALFLLSGGLLARRSTGELAAVSHVTGKFLIVMGVGTSVFRALLPMLGVQTWIAGYALFIVALTIVIAVRAKRASHLSA